MTSKQAAEKFLECFLAYPEDYSLMQTCAYGLGVIAKRTPKGQFAQIEQSLKAIYGFIAQDDSRTNEDKIQCTDNCISAIGKHVIYHFDGEIIPMTSVKELL